jgi:phosphatidylserine/phosphatidylglycerophosphate/cardiolipin synthase-like enzyme
VLGGTPDTYQKAGLRRGTATSKSTTAGTTSQIIGSARQSLIIVAFAAYRVPDVSSALAKAAARGVDVRMVLETVADSGGKLTFDAAAAFGGLAGVASFWVWPADKRALPGGGHAAMHAKAAIADEHTALVTSANLTGAAQDYNMELGILLNGGPIPRRLAHHYRALMAAGILVPAN